jgi:hypothetical protein
MATKKEEKDEQDYFTEKAKEPEPKAPAKKGAEKDETVEGHIRIKGTPSDKTRLFQTSPDVKEWLTESEATAQGFYWRDEKKLGPA